MTQIMTVLGAIEPDDLGLTSMHEHVVYDGNIYHERFISQVPQPAPVAPEDKVSLDNFGCLRHGFIMSRDACSMHDEEVMIVEMADFKASGGSALVDMSTPGIRSDLPAIRRISEKSGVHVVATTGLYAEDSWPEKYREMTVEEYTKYMLKEIQEGIEDTDIKPGHIKIAIEEGPTEQGEKLLKAAARVSNETGFSATIHQGTWMTAEEVRKIIKILTDEGMDPQRAIICHIQDFFVEYDLKTLVTDQNSWKLEIDFAKELADLGFNLSIDCFGHYWDAEVMQYINQTDWQRLAGLVALVKDGYAGQIVLGTDTFIKILTRRFGGEGYCRLTNYVLPTLKLAEISDADIKKMTVGNPARLLSY